MDEPAPRGPSLQDVCDHEFAELERRAADAAGGDPARSLMLYTDHRAQPPAPIDLDKAARELTTLLGNSPETATLQSAAIQAIRELAMRVYPSSRTYARALSDLAVAVSAREPAHATACGGMRDGVPANG